MKLFDALSFLAIALLPVYLWSSGGIQLSHIGLALCFLLYSVFRGFAVTKAEVLLLALLAYMLTREAFAIYGGASAKSLLPPLYMLFSVITLETFRRWLADIKRQRLFARGLIAATTIAVCGVLILGYSLVVDAEGQRAVGTFNNPNQLGYFAVCIFSVFTLLSARGIIERRKAIVILIAACFLAVASLSKAAMISVAVGACVLGFSLSRSKQAFVLFGLVSCVAVFAVVYAFQAGALDEFRFVSRLASIGRQSDDSLAGRGYNVLFSQSASTLLFGRGYEGVDAFVGHEVHSTVASFFASYGVVGGGLFTWFLVHWAMRLWRDDGLAVAFCVVGPCMLYGITHNGSRFSIFWLLLAFSLSADKSKMPGIHEARLP